MILVLLGTQNNSFVRLLKEIEKCIDSRIIKEKVIAQVGNTKFDSEKMTVKNFYSQEEMLKLIDSANFIISHGGVGSIISCIKKEKKVIAVPRLKEYKEHVNNHQIQIVQSLSKKGFIIGIKQLNELSEEINNIEKFEPKKFVSNTEKMINKIEEYINNI